MEIESQREMIEKLNKELNGIESERNAEKAKIQSTIRKLHEEMKKDEEFMEKDIPWIRFVDKETNCAYFYNRLTCETTWEEPEKYVTHCSAVETHELSPERRSFDASDKKSTHRRSISRSLDFKEALGVEYMITKVNAFIKWSSARTQHHISARDDVEKRKEKLQKELSTKGKHLEAKAAEIKEKSCQVEAMEDMITVLQKQVLEGEDLRQRLQHSIQEVLEEVKDCKTNMDVEIRAHHDANLKIKSLSEELGKTKIWCLDFEKEKKSLLDVTAALEAKVSDMNKKIHALENEKDKTEEHISNLEMSLEKSMASREKLRLRLEKNENDLLKATESLEHYKKASEIHLEDAKTHKEIVESQEVELKEIKAKALKAGTNLLKLDKEKKSLENALRVCETSLNISQQKLKISWEKISALTAEKNMLSSNNKVAHAALCDAKVSLTWLTSELREIQKDITKKESDRQELAAKFDAQSNVLKKTEMAFKLEIRHCEELRNELKKSHVAVENLDKEVQVSKNELTAAKRESLKREQALQLSKGETNQAVQELESRSKELRAAETDLLEKNQKIEVMAKNSQSLKEERDQMEKSLAKAHSSLRESQQCMREVKSENDRIMKNLDHEKARVGTLVKELQDSRTEANQAVNDSSTTQVLLEESKAKLKDSERKLELKEASLARSNRALEASKKSGLKIQANINNLYSELKDANARVESLTEELQASQIQINQSANEKDATRILLEVAESKRLASEHEARSLKSKIEDFNAEIESLKGNIDLSKMEEARAQAELLQAQEEANRVRDERDQYATELRSLRLNLAEAKKRQLHSEQQAKQERERCEEMHRKVCAGTEAIKAAEKKIAKSKEQYVKLKMKSEADKSRLSALRAQLVEKSGELKKMQGVLVQRDAADAQQKQAFAKVKVEAEHYRMLTHKLKRDGPTGKLQSLKKEHEAHLKRVLEEVETSRKKLSEAMSEIASRDQAAHRTERALKNQNKVYLGKIKSLEQRNKETATALEHLKNRFAQTQSAIKMSEARIGSEFENKLMRAKGLMEKHKQQHTQLQNKFEGLENQHRQAVREMVEHKNNRAKLEKKGRVQAKLLGKLADMVETLLSNAEGADKENGGSNDIDIEIMKKQATKLVEENAELKIRLAENSNQQGEFTLNEELKRLRDENASLVNHHNPKQRIRLHQQIKKENQLLQTEVHKLRKELEKLKIQKSVQKAPFKERNSFRRLSLPKHPVKGAPPKHNASWSSKDLSKTILQARRQSLAVRKKFRN